MSRTLCCCNVRGVVVDVSIQNCVHDWQLKCTEKKLAQKSRVVGVEGVLEQPTIKGRKIRPLFLKAVDTIGNYSK